MATNLKSIKIDNVRSVFSSVSKNKTISRLDISEITGLSRVTVGKIADALILANILSEEKKVNNCAGRRAGMLSLSTDRVAIIGSVDENGAEISIYDLSLNLRESFSCTDNDDELVNILADASMAVLEKYGVDNCIGVSLIVSPTLDAKYFSDQFASFFPDMLVVSDVPVNLSAQYYSAGMGEEEMLLFIRAGSGYIHGTLFINNVKFARRGGRSVDFGAAVFPDGQTLSEKFSDDSGTEAHITLFANCICNAAMVILPDKVVVEIDSDCYREDIDRRIKECAVHRLGEESALKFSTVPADDDISSSYRGAMHCLFEKWLETFVLEG